MTVQLALIGFEDSNAINENKMEEYLNETLKTHR